MKTLTEGTRIFNRGDMANIEHFGTIIKVKTDRWGTHYRIRIDEEDRTTEREEYEVPKCMVHEVDKGHGGTRIVTEEAYNRLGEERIREFKERYGKKEVA